MNISCYLNLLSRLFLAKKIAIDVNTSVGERLRKVVCCSTCIKYSMQEEVLHVYVEVDLYGGCAWCYRTQRPRCWN